MADWTIGRGDLCHIALLTGDRGRAKGFYGAVFGWRFDDLPGADYTMIATSEIPPSDASAKSTGL